jgi:hypothetical protein
MVERTTSQKLAVVCETHSSVKVKVNLAIAKSQDINTTVVRVGLRTS